MATFACTIDETAQAVEKADPPRSLRIELLNLWGIVGMAKWYFTHGEIAPRIGKPWLRSLYNVFVALQYQSRYPSTRKRTPMKDMDAYVAMWVRIVKGLATSHNKKELDNCEFEMESALGPILTAPVKQLRDFYAKLCKALREDPEIPFFVWSMFEAWGEVILKDATNDQVVELKNDLAAKIAEMVEADVQPDLKDAIAGALRWRSPGDLEKIDAHLETEKKNGRKGPRPKLVGKESCLFLQVGDHTVML